MFIFFNSLSFHIFASQIEEATRWMTKFSSDLSHVKNRLSEMGLADFEYDVLDHLHRAYQRIEKEIQTSGGQKMKDVWRSFSNLRMCLTDIEKSYGI